jgi:hypothetical protein
VCPPSPYLEPPRSAYWSHDAREDGAGQPMRRTNRTTTAVMIIQMIAATP